MNRLRPRRENDDILRSPASELMESGHLSVPSSPLLSPTAAMLTRTGANNSGPSSSSAAAAGRRRAHTFDNHFPTTSSFPTTSQFAAPQESAHQHQPSSLPSASRFFGQPPSAEAATTSLFHNPPAAGNNPSSAAQQLAKAHQVLREEIESLTKQITESNDAYVRREEELCARLSDEQRKLEEMVRRKPTPEELTELDARGQYVTKLREEIEAKAHQLRSHEHSDFLTNTIADRVMGHIHFVESLAETLSHAIEPVKALSTSFKASLSIASKNEPPSSSSLPKEAETDDDSSLSSHILSSVEGVTAEQVHATKEACPSTAHCFVQVSRLRHFTEGLSDLLIEEGGHLADRFRQLEEAHIAARRTMNQQTEMLSEAQSALARLLDDMDEWKQRAEEKAKRLQALELERKAKAESQHPQSYSSGGGAAYGLNASSRNNSMGVSDAELESRNEELRHQIQLLTADCYREDERLASLHAEVSSLKHKEDTERKAVAEATEMLAQRRAQTKTMEKEKSDCLLKLAVAEEGKANGERQLARLQTDLEDAMEEITRQSGRLKAAELQLEETVIVHRHARRELEASRTQATAAQGRLAVRQAEVTNLAQSLEQKRAERGKLRNESLAVQTKLVELRRKVHDQLDEVQYITCLLPKNHPAGQGSKKLWVRLQAFDATSHPTASTDDGKEDEDEERKRSQAEQKAAEEYDAMLSERTERAREMRSTLLDSAKKAERERKEQQEMEHRRASAHAPVTITGSVSPTHSPSSLRPLSPPYDEIRRHHSAVL